MRKYATLAVVGATAWFVVVPRVGAAIQPASSAGAMLVAAGPSEACVWIDGQRVHFMGEAGRLAEAQRGELARRLGELAALVGRR